MNAPRVVIPILALGCLAAGWGAWRLELRLVGLRNRVQADRQAAFSDRLASTQQTQKDLEQQLAQLQAAAKTEAGGKAPGAAASASSAVDPAAKRQALIAFAKGWMQNSAPMFQHLFRSLNLSDGQMGQVRDLTAERLVDAYTAMRPMLNGGAVDPDAMKEAVAQATASTTTQLKQVLGDSGYAQLEQQLQLAPAESAVAQMNRNLAGTGVILTDGQQDQIAQLLAQNQTPPKNQQSFVTLLNGMAGNGEITVTDAVVTQAAGVLGPDQLAAVQQYQAEQQAKAMVIKSYQQAMRQAMKQVQQGQPAR